MSMGDLAATVMSDMASTFDTIDCMATEHVRRLRGKAKYLESMTDMHPPGSSRALMLVGEADRLRREADEFETSLATARRSRGADAYSDTRGESA